MPFAYYMLVHMIQLIWDDLETYRKVTTVISGVLFGTVAILNYYWFYLMILRVKALVSGKKPNT